MSIEDFSTYIESDASSRITLASRRITFADLDDTDADTYAYVDKGAAYFAADFTVYATLNITASEQNHLGSNVFGVANTLNDIQSMLDDSESGLFVHVRHPNSPNELQLNVWEIDSGTGYVGSGGVYYTMTAGTIYYLKIYRDEGTGTYGTFYCNVYSDPARTDLLAARSVALHTSKKDFQYLYAIQSYDQAGTPQSVSGWVQDFEVSLSLETPTVTTELLTDISGTTATGNGTIVSTGISSVTAHGMVWATTIDPTTADSSTDEGAGSVGAFTSSITGLIEGQAYYFRAYATNTQGTSYGNNVKLLGGFAGSQLEKGNFSVVETRLHYVDADGKERYIEGTLV